jgi:mono/diheme cytochrome c family protein
MSMTRPNQAVEPTRTRPAARPAPAAWALAALAATLGLAACSGGGGSEDTVTVNGDVPIAYVKRATSVGMNPTDGANFAPGGDLMLREKSSPSATEHNLTARFTQGNGDASDPEVSYDGKKIVFAMRCPSSNISTIDGVAACTGRWNIWEYDMSSGGLTGGTYRRLTASTSADDVDPVYLPGNRGIVFSSNRQAKSSRSQALGRAYFAADEYERERVMNLHTMAADGSNVQQISFNMSHERNPVIRPNGDIMFARWEHVADRNRFAIFRAKPDGTDMFVLYGAHSPGNSYLHPRDTDPKGRYPGQLVSSLMPLSGTQEGGSLQLIDAARYSEFNTPAGRGIPASGGQREATERTLSDGRGLSLFGRATTPYPLWDGSDRVLVSWKPCEVTRNGVVVSCQTLTDEEKTRLASNRTRAAAAADPVQDNAPSAYAVYMFNPANQTWLIVAAPPPGFMHTDPIALTPRTEPNVVEPTTVDPALAARNMALIEVRSVFDTDGLNRMAAQMLVASDRGPGCSTNIPQTAPHEAADTRTSVADLAKMRDPADPAYRCNAAWFVRATRGVPPPSGMGGARQTIGETDFEQNQILGYAPIEPDGSFKLEVPADIPLALSVIDADGRAIQTHTNWIQVRPGERRTCDGCHSPRRGAALNSGPVVGGMPAGVKRAFAAAHTPGETMASLRTRLDPAALALATSPVFTDVWADNSVAGVAVRPTISLRYRGNADPADDLATPEPVNGVINYPEHIQPLWTRARGPAGAHTCIACHSDAAKLDLRGTIAGTGRLVSYEELLLGDPVIDPATGRPVTRLRDGVPEVVRGPSLVNTSSGDANSAGLARKSRLTELLWGQTLLAGGDARTAFPGPAAGGLDHSRLLNKAEKRLLAEWMDLGGQYYNDPFDPTGGVRSVDGLSQATFMAQVQPILQAQCATCHQAGLGNPRNRFVLTGSEEGDYNVTLSLISNTCAPASNALLQRPSTVPHPSGDLMQTTALLPVGSAGYEAIASWIRGGCGSGSPSSAGLSQSTRR